MYCKLFASLYQGTLRGRSDEILVFTNLLAHTSAGGVVDKHFRAIAEETGLSVERVKQAIQILESPDEESRSPDYDGARLVRLDEHRAWGWLVVNHAKYRAYRNEEDRAEKNRQAQARFREKKKQAATGESNADVMESNQSNASKPIQKQEAEAKEEHTEASPVSVSDSPKPKPRPLNLEEVFEYADKQGIKHGEAEDFWDKMEAGGWKRGKAGNIKIADWHAHFRNYHRNGWLNDKPQKGTKKNYAW